MKRETNMRFCLLSLLGIIFVVDGHLEGSILDVGGLFPYYSFHMPLFVFISGYFYKRGSELEPVSYVRHKFMKLMVPYLAWNLVYGLVAAFLRRYGDFSFGEPVTVWNLVVEPFRHGYQFILNHAAWFVPTLFLVELANVELARVPGLGRVEVRAAACFLGGLGGICLARSVGNEGFWLTLEKVLFLLPFYGLGTLYREKLEQKDTVGNLPYFAVTAGLAFLLGISGQRLIYAVSDCGDFTGYLLPYITGVLGIGFWLRVAGILAPVCSGSRFVRYWGRNTFPIMMHHMMVFLVIRTGFAALAKYGTAITDFSYERYKGDFYYCYLPGGVMQWKILYLAAGILLPLCLQWVMAAAWGRLRAGGIFRENGSGKK